MNYTLIANSGIQLLTFRLKLNPQDKFKMWFHERYDTSNVSMSDVEALFMLKNDYLKSQDIVGTENYITADGSISEGTVVNLRNVEFGGLELDNVKASIVRNQKALLLLGQSVLKRLGKIEIDYSKKVLKITYREKVK